MRHVVSDNQAELDDDRVVEIDALRCCAGYSAVSSILEPLFDPIGRTAAV